MPNFAWSIWFSICMALVIMVTYVFIESSMNAASQSSKVKVDHFELSHLDCQLFALVMALEQSTVLDQVIQPNFYEVKITYYDPDYDVIVTCDDRPGYSNRVISIEY